MKKLLMIIFLFMAFSCQDMTADEPSRDFQLDGDLSPSTENRGIDIANAEVENIVAAFDKLKKDTALAKRTSRSQTEHEAKVELSKQLVLILYNNRNDMPQSLRDSQDWNETMKRDPVAAEFGNKLNKLVDELPPLESDCDFWEYVMGLFNCLWSTVRNCIVLPGCNWEDSAAHLHGCITIHCIYPF